MSGSVSSRFSPRSLEPAQLGRLTVAREELVTQISSSISNAVISRQARFDLVLGPRGAGKSHLIGLIEHRFRSSEKLSDRAVVVALPEELHPTSLVHFLAQILRELPDDPELGPAIDAVRSLQRQRDANQERRAVDLIRGRLGDRSLILLVENLDELFEALGRDGQLRLRNILQTERCWSIVATSRSLIPAFTKYEAPFHGTFNLHRLAPLSPEQCRDMLAALADAHAKPELAALLRSPRGLQRVRGIHHLLDGNPRAMAFMFRQLDARRLDHFELALGDLADELKPYFQEQLTRVSPAQRAIIELLAESWRPLTVTEIAERSFSAQASASGALRHLRRDAVVRDFELGRERYYELGDPLLRLARANELPGRAIATFARVIRAWYGDDSDADFAVRQYEVLPKSARDLWVAHDGFEESRTHSELTYAQALLEQGPERAIAEARRQLGVRESAPVRAVLVLALEAAGDLAGAVEQFFAGPGALDTELQAWTMLLAADLRRLTARAPAFDLTHVELGSTLARAVQSPLRAIVGAAEPEARRALLDAFDEANPAITQLLSNLAVRFVLHCWIRSAAFADLGQLLARLRPTQTSPSLEESISLAIEAAWHHRRVAELLPPGASLDSLLEPLPTNLRSLIGLASIDALAGCDMAGSPVDAGEELSRRISSAGVVAPPAELDGLLGFEILVCVLLDVFAQLADFGEVAAFMTSNRELLAFGLDLNLYRWIASRRDLRPLARVADLLGHTPALAGAAIHAKSPREAVARLSEAERALVRALLERYHDREGFEALGLARKPKRGAKS